jgi:hypothetical protein
MYDLIGDIHGHADALERLLARLGYTRQPSRPPASDRPRCDIRACLAYGSEMAREQFVDIPLEAS